MGDFFLVEVGCSFYMKNELKSEIFNNKKSLETKMFFCHNLTKNLNWEMLTKNLVVFKILKDEMELRMKNQNIMGVH